MDCSVKKPRAEVSPSACSSRPVYDRCYQIPSCLSSAKPKGDCPEPKVRKLTRGEIENLLNQDTCRHGYMSPVADPPDDTRSWSLSSQCRRQYFLDQMGLSKPEEVLEKIGPDLPEIVELEVDEVHQMLAPSQSVVKSAPVEAPILSVVASKLTPGESLPAQTAPNDDSSMSPAFQANESADSGFDEASSLSEPFSSSESPAPAQNSLESNPDSPLITELPDEDSEAKALDDASGATALPNDMSEAAEGPTESSETPDASSDSSAETPSSEAQAEVNPDSATKEATSPTLAENASEAEALKQEELVAEEEASKASEAETAAGAEFPVFENVATSESPEALTEEGQNEVANPSIEEAEASDSRGNAPLGPCVPQTCAEVSLMQEIQKLTTQNAVLETKVGMLTEAAASEKRQRQRSFSSPAQSGRCRANSSHSRSTPPPPCCQTQSPAQAELLKKLAALKEEKSQLLAQLECDADDDDLDDVRQRQEAIEEELESLRQEREEKLEKIKHLAEILKVRESQLEKIQERMAAERGCLECEIEKVKGQLLALARERRDAEEEVCVAKEQLQRQLARDKCFLEGTLKLMRELESLKSRSRPQESCDACSRTKPFPVAPCS